MNRLVPALLLLLATPAWAADSGAEGVNTGLAAGLAVLVLVCAAVTFVQRGWGLFLTSVAGLGVALYSTSEKITLLHGGPSTCGANEVINCTPVLTSAASELAGIPVSLFGAGFYCAMAFLALRLARGQSKDAPVLLAIGGVLAVAFDVYLGAQMLHIGAACMFCLASYGLNLTLLVGATVASRGLSVGESLPRALPAEGGAAVVLGLVGLIGGVMWYQGAVKGDEGSTPKPAPTPTDAFAVVAANTGAFYEQVGGTIETDGTEPVYGDPAAKFTIVEWADFQCPHCAHMFEEMHELLADNKDVRLLYKNYPISSKCNRFVEREGHAQACGAAAAGECARQQGRFWELAGKMFGNQEYLGLDDIKFMVEQVGMDSAAFEACMAKPETGQAVVMDVDAGGKANVQGTPSLFIKGAWGDSYVRLNASGKEAFDILMAAARTGKPMPPAPAPAPEQ